MTTQATAAAVSQNSLDEDEKTPRTLTKTRARAFPEAEEVSNLTNGSANTLGQTRIHGRLTRLRPSGLVPPFEIELVGVTTKHPRVVVVV
jgi:hypothetical protein